MERYRGRRKKGYRRMDDKYLQNLVNDTVIRITKKMTGVSMPGCGGSRKQVTA